MHYEKGIFGWFLGGGLHLLWHKFTYFRLHPVHNTMQEVSKSSNNKTRCRITHLAMQSTIRKYLTQISSNTLDGNFGQLDNLCGARLTFVDETIRGENYIYGFKPYFYCELEEDGEKSAIYMVYTKEKTFSLIQCKIEQHNYILKYILSVSAIKLFNKMCAWCGTTRGDGKDNALRKCECKGCRYCTEKCQHKHWDFHKVLCTAKATRDKSTRAKSAGVELQVAEDAHGELREVVGECPDPHDPDPHDLDLQGAQHGPPPAWIAAIAPLATASDALLAEMEATLASFLATSEAAKRLR